jgi:hypothetical protein
VTAGGGAAYLPVMARLAALVLLAFVAGCSGGDDLTAGEEGPVDSVRARADSADEPTELRVTFRVTGMEVTERHEISCNPPGGDVPDPTRVCERLAANDALYFPEDGLECPLPVPLTYLSVTGTHRGDELEQMMSPCTDPETRAVDAWSELLGFEQPPLDRR